MKKNKISIRAIGIEFEFEIGWWYMPNQPLADALVSEWNIQYPKFKVEYDKEYYDSQIEFKLFMTNDMLDGVAMFKKFLTTAYTIFPKVSATGKPYVGTHIHLFLEKDGVPYEKIARGKKYILFDYTINHFYKWMKSMKATLNANTFSREVSRLVSNHNILRYYDNKYLGNNLKKNLEEFGRSYAMFHNEPPDRPKYSPILWSLPNETTGKPMSLEIRYIPNTWFLSETPIRIYKFIKQFENELNNKLLIDEKSYIESIAKAHYNLCELSREN